MIDCPTSSAALLRFERIDAKLAELIAQVAACRAELDGQPGEPSIDQLTIGQAAQIASTVRGLV
jgi:hypothetical protein